MLEQDYSATYNNKQTIRLLIASTAQFNIKLQYINIKYHWLQEKMQNSKIIINEAAIADMPADSLTKLLSGQNHRKLLKYLSLVDISD